jgi:NTE family protein
MMGAALVLSAGGMFAAWEAGVWKSLHGRFTPSLVVGASAGALNGWLIASGVPPDELCRAWLDPALRKILNPTRQARALNDKARELFTKYQPQIPFGLTVTEAPRLRPRLVSNGDITWRHLAATCSIPLVFPSIRINGAHYVDGGFLGALPLWAAEEMGATRAIAVNCLTTLPFRMLRTILPIKRASPSIEVTMIEPSLPLGSLYDACVWSAANIERWIELGESDGHRAASSITM